MCCERDLIAVFDSQVACQMHTNIDNYCCTRIVSTKAVAAVIVWQCYNKLRGISAVTFPAVTSAAGVRELVQTLCGQSDTTSI
jgi:hypothetical protein